MKKFFLVLVVATHHLTSFSAEPVKENSSGKQTLSSDNGRYVFGQVSQNRQDQFLIDTKTGRMWQLVEGRIPAASDGTAPASTAIFLKPIPYSDGTGKTSLEPK